MTSVSGGIVGEPELPIKPGIVRTVLDLIVAGAKELCARKVVTPNMHEDRISEQLDQEMRAAHRGTDSDIVNWAMRPDIPTSHKATIQIGKADFTFYWDQIPRDPNRYLAVEAKKLRGKHASLASKYADEGVLRFVNGKYGQGHDHGIMMGYIVVAPLSNAISSVKTAMDKRKVKTRECLEFSPNGSLCTHPYTHHSRHLQDKATVPMTLIHIFLDFS